MAEEPIGKVDLISAFPYVHPLISAGGGWQGNRISEGLGKLEFLAAILLAGRPAEEQCTEMDMERALKIARRLCAKAEELRARYDDSFPP